MKEGKKIKDWKITKWLKEKAPHIADAVGDVLPDKGALGILKNLISKDEVLSPEEKEHALNLIKLDNEVYYAQLQDTANARDLQKEALQQEDLFSKRYVYYLSSFWSVSAVVYIFVATFTEIINENISNTVLGFLLGTIIATIINFYFGSSKGSKEKQEILNKLNKGNK